MSLIFPGMDPYLEDPPLWPGVHSALVVYLRDQLQPALQPRYVAAVEERVYIEGPPDRQFIPDLWIKRAGRPEPAGAAVAELDEPEVLCLPSVEIREPYIQILDLHSGQRVVAVIEVVSPSNKCPGPGRDAYLAKQREIMGSTAHLIEIDLLRAGEHVLSVPSWLVARRAPYDYLICANRAAGPRDLFDIYARRLRDRLPRIRIPLAGDDPDVRLDLQASIEKTCEAGSYRARIDYAAPCRPPLPPDDQAWARQLCGQTAKMGP
jgi:hypothetical protein